MERAERESKPKRGKIQGQGQREKRTVYKTQRTRAGRGGEKKNRIEGTGLRWERSGRIAVTGTTGQERRENSAVISR